MMKEAGGCVLNFDQFLKGRCAIIEAIPGRFLSIMTMTRIFVSVLLLLVCLPSSSILNQFTIHDKAG
jgi:hypothetical protein